MKLELKYGTRSIPFEVVRAKRKTVKIVVTPPDQVVVTVPMKMNKDQILDIVQVKGKWIVQKIDYFKEFDYLPVKREYVNGELFMCLGNHYPLYIEYDSDIKKPEVMLSKDQFIIKTNMQSKEVIRKAMEQWYRDTAKNVIEERVKYYQKYFYIEPKDIKVKEQRKRWGSCTYDNRLLFNWRCIMATLESLDYVVVHEMSHMVHKNHSKQFWSFVEAILPDYKARKLWLRNNGIKMNI
ncbi:SprT family zinc-dependent metalloprotease [Defluviitalea saccharophila]|uniref:SprT family zinc-dependent metalloprotease n=1 Tax=Defluviitalea saccharophila TaxID=879970 RepID=A0ABZ2Y3T3_9FIRM